MPDATQFVRLMDIMTALRSPEGCPWDREQDLETLKPFLIEEAYEVLDAIDSGDHAAHREELGDLLFQVVFQAQIRDEEGAFNLTDVAQTLADKLERRHPHVFGAGASMSREEVRVSWDQIKRAERDEKGRDPSALAGVPAALPALLRADRIGKKAASVGFDWPDTVGVYEKISEEVAEVREAVQSGDRSAIQHEIGDLLLAVTNLSRHLKVEPESALQDANRRFDARFRAVERYALEGGSEVRELSLSALDSLWERAKAEERDAPA
jgi:MazG family protein